ncbi:MAG: DNA polymerase III subunit alpha [Desulfobacteraceae bacterium]|nr:DNA polymerase III subunit alpha [Desulfobacteraceae bacterium]
MQPVHLHVHTQYSLLDGQIRIGDLLSKCKQYGMGAVAITDHGTMFGVLDFYQEAKKEGIKPIIGCECYVAPRTMQDKTTEDSKGIRHLTLLAKDMAGYRNLCKLATAAQMEGFYYKPRIDRAILERHCEGLIALSGCLKGGIAQHILAGKMDEGEKAALYYEKLFGKGNFFLEVQQNGLSAQGSVNRGLLALYRKLGIPLVATNDCHYLNQADAKAHEVLLCIQTGKTMQDYDRFSFETDQLFFKSGEQMTAEFKDYPGAIENTVAIAEKCDLKFEFGKYYFPQYDAKSGKTADQLFEEQVSQGYAERLERLVAKNPGIDRALYDERLAYELKTIIKMGFAGYFLIVADFIRYAKKSGIPVGPGRGSAAGSLVSYALFITDLDPIEHELIFERFLNPSRISMPDIDVDFCIKGRERVFKYVVDRYGPDYVAQIITYGTMKARMVIRDVGRALDLELRQVDAIAKLVPDDDLKMTISKALEQEPRLAEMVKKDPQVRQLIEVSKALEGLPRHASTHAAGVVIGDRPLVEHLPLYKGKKGEVVTQLDMQKVEEIGLVKFDFLGLRNLTVIDSALQMIALQGKEPPDLSNLSLNDPKTFELLQAGDSTGVFQLESSGIKSLMVRLRPENFAELTALVALYRPGPLDSGMVDDFVERKHGRKPVEYADARLASILKETYGVMVYQEQVMKVAGVLAGYSMAEADSLRKAIGKKIEKLMAEHRQKFVKGCVANAVPEAKATELFDLIEKFGGYGFNKSHSAAYALIAYHTAYLKAHYPVEFMAALLSESGTTDDVVKFINECRIHKVQILAPDINQSRSAFTVIDGKIRFGLAAVKNVGQAAIEIIIKEREKNGDYDSLIDFCKRVDLQKANKRVLESLIRCGAFDSTGCFRSRLMGGLEETLSYGQSFQKECASAQMCLFGEEGDGDFGLKEPFIPALKEWPDEEKLAFEKEALGFYVSGHPLDQYRVSLEKHASCATIDLAEIEDGQQVHVGGLVKTVKTILTKKNERMAFISIEDMQGTVEVVVFSSVFNDCVHLMAEDQPVLVFGKVQKDENAAKILAERIVLLDQADEHWNVEAHFLVDADKTNEGALEQLFQVFKKHPGAIPAYIELKLPEGEVVTVIEVCGEHGIHPTQAMASEVNGLFGYEAMKVERIFKG